MKVAVLFSGGKDSTYSIYKVKQMGHDVKCLVTIFPKSSNSHLLHFSTIESTELQSRTLEIPQIISTLDSDELKEEMNVLEILLKKAKQNFQIEGLVHGGISSEFQKKCFEKICKKIDLKIIAPLWKLQFKRFYFLLSNKMKDASLLIILIKSQTAFPIIISIQIMMT